MKKHILLSVLAGLALPVASALAWEVATPVAGTAITAVPFVISKSGNYYLASNLVFNSPAGAAITITASQVYLDLNGKTLSSGVDTGFNVGVFVFNQKDVTIQEGDIDGFFYGVYFAPNSTDNNAKNTVDNVKFNDNGIGVLSVSGTSNWVKNCVIDGGDIGIYFWADLGGSRAQNNILENQKRSERLGFGIALLSQSSGGVVFDDNVVSKGSSSIGMAMSGTDKYRFDSFVGFPVNSPHVGGTNELADSL